MTALTIESPLVPPRGIEKPLEIPPPTPTHPLRVRRVLSLLYAVQTSDDKVAAALELFDAVGGIGGEATFTRFSKTPDGRRLLRTKPDLVSILGDREMLAALPDGSLGRAYLAFAEKNGFAADNLVEMNARVDRERAEMDEHRDWFWDRFTMAHDLWHVMTDCGADGDGEIRLLAFSFAQTPQRGYGMLLALSTFSQFFRPSFHLAQWRAFRVGRRASDLVVVPWEQYLAWPLDEVRRCYGVEVIGA